MIVNNSSKSCIRRSYHFLSSISGHGEWCFLRDLIGPPTKEYPALFNSEHKQMAYSFASVTEEEFCLMNKAVVQNNSKKAKKFGNKLFKDIYFFYFLAINTHSRRNQNVLFIADGWATSRCSVELF